MLAEVWAAVLMLASLRSPLAPGYAVMALLWLFSLRAPGVRRKSGGLGIAAIWLIAAVTPPFEPETLTLYTLLQQTLLLGVTTALLIRVPSARPEATGS